MRKHLSLRSGNPALHKNTFRGLQVTGNQTMTIDGTVNKTSIALIGVATVHEALEHIL